MKIAIAGGSGFIGRHLTRYYAKNKVDVILITRTAKAQADHDAKTVTWQQLAQSVEPLNGVDAIINLAGESINQKWTQAAKQRILQSRLETVANLKQIIEKLERKPEVLINASGMSYYGTSETDTYDERSPFRNTDFLADVVRQWEQAVDEIKGVRIVKVRVGVVLGKDGGAFPKMSLPYKLGVGGRVGNGNQWFSWIHMTDMVRLIDYCIHRQQISGPVNGTAPQPITNREFGRILAKGWRRPNICPVPAFVFKLIFGELAVLLLEGQKVIPQVLLDQGFEFTYPSLEKALVHL